MKLLIITQKVDKEDPILGFFHGWLKKLSEKFEKITVICLEKGRYELSQNVKVLSLGKETGKNKIKYIINFYKYIWQEKENYNAVFVHMNQEYVLLGWKIWKIFGKKIFLWRNHPKGSFLTRIAIWLSNKVFYTSPDSYTAKFLQKAVKMPVGIDIEKFKTQNPRIRVKNSILSLGRISPIKNIHLMLHAVRLLRQKGVDFNFDIVGDPVNFEDEEYKNKLISENQDLIKEKIVHFYPSVPNYKTLEIYSKHAIFLNLTPSGSFDKTILEATICGCIPLVGNTNLQGQFGGDTIPNLNPETIASKLVDWINVEDKRMDEFSTQLQNFVIENHSLTALVEKLAGEIK